MEDLWAKIHQFEKFLSKFESILSDLKPIEADLPKLERQKSTLEVRKNPSQLNFDVLHNVIFISVECERGIFGVSPGGICNQRALG